MAVKQPGFLKSNYPYAQTSITPITAGNSKLKMGNAKSNWPYAQTSITPIGSGMKQKPIPPLPGVAVSGGSYGFPT
jgi:hypothetical protein